MTLSFLAFAASKASLSSRSFLAFDLSLADCSAACARRLATSASFASLRALVGHRWRLSASQAVRSDGSLIDHQ
jgi:hypothetical protein